MRIILAAYVASIVVACAAVPHAFAAPKRIAATNDWLTAVRVVQAAYPGSSAWLLSCSRGEGGHGEWVWNGGYPLSRYPSRPSGSSGAGGWVQYMQGTFNGDMRRAVADLLGRGFQLPANIGWTNALGQALAAGWAYSHDRPMGKWLGSGC